MALLWSAFGSLAPPSLVRVWGAFPALSFVACFVVVDAVAYLYDWVGHHTLVGWASHRVHHLGETFDMTLVLRQPWLPVHGLVIIPLTALAGFPFEWRPPAPRSRSPIRRCNTRAGTGASDGGTHVLVSGRAHRRHHVVDSGAVNLGMVFNVWDRALGTWCADAVEPDATYGVGAPEPVSALAIQVDGWREVRPMKAGRDRAADPMSYHMIVSRRQVLVQLDDDLVERLDRLAEREGTNRSELLRRGAAAVLAADEVAEADRSLRDAYRRVPQDPAIVAAAARLAARTAPEW